MLLAIITWTCPVCGGTCTEHNPEQLERCVESHEYRVHGIIPGTVVSLPV